GSSARAFLYIDGIGHEISRSGSRTAAGLLIASRGLLGPAEGISVPFVARVRGSTRPLRVVVGRVDPCRVLLVKNPRRALIERVTGSGETADRGRVIERGHVVLRSCRCAGSRSMTAFSCRCSSAWSAARWPDCPRRSVFIAHAYCSRRSSMLIPPMRPHRHCAGVVALERELDIPRRAVPVLADLHEQFAGGLFAVLVEEDHDIGVLLDAAGLSEVCDAGESAILARAVPVELRQDDDGYLHRSEEHT